MQFSLYSVVFKSGQTVLTLSRVVVVKSNNNCWQSEHHQCLFQFDLNINLQDRQLSFDMGYWERIVSVDASVAVTDNQLVDANHQED